MSVLIKGMKMPTEGLVTVNIHSDGLVYVHGAYPTELHEAVYIPMTRCKDCEFYTEEDRWCRRLGLCGAFDPNDYCSHAEERAEE